MMIKVNEYLEGNVKSLGFELDGVPYTAGVFLPGEYTFNTEKEEHVTVTVGRFEIRLPKQEWRLVKVGDTVVIPGSSSFNLKVAKPTSYVCMYK
jgi:uncharacterized protein YaiE (UPF0345 family)